MKVELLSITPDAEKLIETAGRISHLSYDTLKLLRYLNSSFFPSFH